MSVATKPEHVGVENGPADTPAIATPTRTRGPRKAKRVDSDGKPMHRLIFVVSGEDKDHILTAITSRIGPMFVRALGGIKISATGDPQEYQGCALAAICEDWQLGIEDESDK